MVLLPKAHHQHRYQGFIDAFVNSGTGQAKILINRLDRDSVDIAQQNISPFDLTSRSGLRVGQMN